MWEYFPTILKKYKKEIKVKGKERKRKITYIYCLHYTSGGLLVFFDDELTTFRNKNDRFICNDKKYKIGFMGCEKRYRFYAKWEFLSIFLSLKY